MSLLDSLLGQLGGKDLGALSKAIGSDESSTQRAVANALPVLLGALQRNAKQPNGAQSLERALERDHDGGILDDLAGFLGKGSTKEGDGILGHILGGKRDRLEQKLGAASGLDAGTIGKLLPMLAPVVMGALGKERKKQSLDAGGLTDLLGGAEQEMTRANPKAGSFLGSLLDQDGDGDLDLGDVTKGLLGGLFKK